MKSDQQLDISGVVIPFSLAMCKSALAQMAPGGVLEIHLRDHETLRDLLIIVERSGDHVLAWEKREEHCCLWVRRGLDPGGPERPGHPGRGESSLIFSGGGKE